MQASFSEPPVTEGDGAAAAPEAEVDAEVEPAAVQEEGAESEHPLAYHPISSVLARPTILRPAVTGYPTLRIDRTGIWQLVAAEQSESAAARSALPGVEAADSVEPLEPSTDADPFQLPQQAWISPREWIRNPSWINVFMSGGVLEELQEVYHIGTSEASGDETRPSGSRPTISVAAPAARRSVAGPRPSTPCAVPAQLLLAGRLSVPSPPPVPPPRPGLPEVRQKSKSWASHVRDLSRQKGRSHQLSAQVPKSVQKARPKVRVRLAQEVQEVEPESYDVRERSPLRSAPVHLFKTRPLSPRVCRHLCLRRGSCGEVRCFQRRRGAAVFCPRLLSGRPRGESTYYLSLSRLASFGRVLRVHRFSQRVGFRKRWQVPCRRPKNGRCTTRTAGRLRTSKTPCLQLLRTRTGTALSLSRPTSRSGLLSHNPCHGPAVLPKSGRRG